MTVWERPIGVWYVNIQTTSTSGYLTDHFTAIDKNLVINIYVSAVTGSPGSMTIYINIDFGNAPNNGWNPWPVVSWSVSSAPVGTQISVQPSEFPYILTYSCGGCSSSAYYTVQIFMQKP